VRLAAAGLFGFALPESNWTCACENELMPQARTRIQNSFFMFSVVIQFSQFNSLAAVLSTGAE
jgi:hypothetical protein